MRLIVMKVPLFTYQRVKSVVSSMLDKQLISFAVDGIIIKAMDRKYLIGEPCVQEHISEHFNSEGHTGFLENVSVFSYIY